MSKYHSYTVHTHACTCMHVRAHTCMDTISHTHTHARTHSHTHTHSLTHTSQTFLTSSSSGTRWKRGKSLKCWTIQSWRSLTSVIVYTSPWKATTEKAQPTHTGWDLLVQTGTQPSAWRQTKKCNNSNRNTLVCVKVNKRDLMVQQTQLTLKRKTIN